MSVAALSTTRGAHATFPSASRLIAGAVRKTSWHASIAATVGQHSSDDPAQMVQLIVLKCVASEMRALQPAVLAHVALMCATSPACPGHVHVISPLAVCMYPGIAVHGGHRPVSAQQPSDPTSVPSQQGPARIVRAARRSARRFIGGRLVEREFVVCSDSLIPLLLCQIVGHGAALFSVPGSLTYARVYPAWAHLLNK